MQIVATPSDVNLAVLAGGSGPIVSLVVEPNSSPQPLASAPIDDSLLDTDMILIQRGGQLQQVPAPALPGGTPTQAQLMEALAGANLSAADASPDGGATLITLGTLADDAATALADAEAAQAGVAAVATGLSSEAATRAAADTSLSNRILSCLTAASLALTPISYPAPGGFGQSQIGSTQSTQNTELAANAVAKGSFIGTRQFENSTVADMRVPGSSTAVPTTGVWSCIENYAFDFAAGLTNIVNPTIDPAKIMQATVNYASAKNQPSALRTQGARMWILLTEAGDYPNWSQLVIPDAGYVFIGSPTGQPICRFICPYDTKNQTFGIADGLVVNQTQETATARCRNVVLSGFEIAKAFTDAVDIWSGLFVSDLMAEWNSGAGDWTDVTPIFSAVASSNTAAIAAMQNGTYVVYFDQTGTDTQGNPTITVQPLSGGPGNRIYASPVQWTLTQFEAAVTAAAGTQGLAGFNIRYLGLGCTVSSVAYSTLAGHTGFQVTFEDPANPEALYLTGAIQQTFPTPKPAQAPQIATQSAPERIAQPAIPAPAIVFHTGQWAGGGGAVNPLTVWNGLPINYPYLARGHAINLVCDNLVMSGIRCMGFSQGQALFEGGGYNVQDVFCVSRSNDMRQDTGGIRWHLGTFSSFGLLMSSGDQSLEPQTGVKFTQSGVPKPWDNQPVTGQIIGARVCCPNAAGLALASNIPNQSQAIDPTGGNAVAGTSTQPFVVGSFSALQYATGGGSMEYAAEIGNLYYDAGAYNPANCPGANVNTNQTHTNNNNFLTFVGNGPAHCIPGSFVIGYSDSGGSTGSLGNTGTPNGVGPFTLVYAPPQSSYGQAVFGRSVASPRMQFSSGIPVGALTGLNNVVMIGGEIKSGAKTCALQIHNGDDQLSNRATLIGTVINAWWQWANGSAGINCTGSNFGGAVLDLFGVKIFDPGYQAISTSGVTAFASDPSCVFGQPQNGRVPGMAFPVGPTGYIVGAPRTLVQGEFQAMVGGQALQVGDVDTALSISTPSPNNSSNAQLDKVKLTFLQNGQFALIVNNSANVLHGDIQYVQAANLGTGSAMGVSLPGNTQSQPAQGSTGFRFRSGDFSGIDGAALTAGTGATWSYCGFDFVWGTAGPPAGQANALFAALVGTGGGSGHGTA